MDATRSTRRRRSLSGAVVAALVGAFMAFPAIASGHYPIPTLGEYATATVDGEISPGEYEGSCVSENSLPDFVEVDYEVRVCEVNDEVNDYWAVEIFFTSYSPDNTLLIFFDNEHDGIVQTGTNGMCPFGEPVEDLIGNGLYGNYGSNGIFDSWYCNAPPGLVGLGDGGSNDGAGAIGGLPEVGPIFLTYEFSHPLDSGDPDDYSVEPGDTLGWCLGYDEAADPTNTYGLGEIEFPHGCFSFPNGISYGETELSADIVKESKLEDLFESLDEKIKDLVATCDLCPPEVRRRLQRLIDQVIQQLKREHAGRANRAMRRLVRTTRKLRKRNALPGRRAKKLIRITRKHRRLLNAPPAKPGPAVEGPGGGPGSPRVLGSTAFGPEGITDPNAPGSAPSDPEEPRCEDPPPRTGCPG